jgi:hypothetical protein
MLGNRYWSFVPHSIIGPWIPTGPLRSNSDSSTDHFVIRPARSGLNRTCLVWAKKYLRSFQLAIIFRMQVHSVHAGNLILTSPRYLY